MICRLWHGWTAREDADAYQAYLEQELYPRLRQELGALGYRGFQLLRRDDGPEVAFVTLTWFDSLESVRAFAGDEYETPVISDKAAGLLRRHDELALHYELADES